MSTLKPKLQQQVFEARFERGYRYLDRCGDAMLVLEELLSQESGFIWFPEEMAPTGARMKCPDLDLKIVFNAHRFVIDWDPVGENACDFDWLANIALSSLMPKLGVDEFTRFGARKFSVVGADDLASASAISVRKSPVMDWCESAVAGMNLNSVEAIWNYELDDRSSGVRVSTKPFLKIGGPVEIDERLRLPPHQLHEKQREALIEQLQRQKRRSEKPDSGWMIDIDYFNLRPPRELTVKDFLARAWELSGRFQERLLNAKSTKNV